MFIHQLLNSSDTFLRQSLTISANIIHSWISRRKLYDQVFSAGSPDESCASRKLPRFIYTKLTRAKYLYIRAKLFSVLICTITNIFLQLYEHDYRRCVNSQYRKERHRVWRLVLSPFTCNDDEYMRMNTCSTTCSRCVISSTRRFLTVSVLFLCCFTKKKNLSCFYTPSVGKNKKKNLNVIFI